MKKIYTLFTGALLFAGTGIIAQNTNSAPNATSDVATNVQNTATDNAPVQQNVIANRNVTPTPSTQAILVDNGPIVTHPGQGAGGADVSALITPLTIFGSNVSFQYLYMVADDFTVNATWDVDSLIFFSYQTGSPLTSTLNALYVAIYNGDPMSGGQIVWGDTVNDQYANTYWSGVYRAQDVALTNNQRPIMKIAAAPATCTLTAGTYWVAWRVGGSLASGPWAPYITYLSQPSTGNGEQKAGGVWSAVSDPSSGDTQGFPFIFTGTVTGIEESNLIKTFGMYPNPTTNFTNINITTSAEINVKDLNFVVYDMLGNEVSRMTELSNSFTYDCSSLSAGMYIYKIVDNNNKPLKAGKLSIQ